MPRTSDPGTAGGEQRGWAGGSVGLTARRCPRVPTVTQLGRTEGSAASVLLLCFSLLSVTFEIEEGADPEMLSRVTQQCAGLALGDLRGTDVATVLEPATLGLLLIDADSTSVPRMVERLTEVWAGSTPTSCFGRVCWSAGAACCPRDGSRGEILLQSAERRMDQARTEGRNRVCVSLDWREVRTGAVPPALH